MTSEQSPTPLTDRDTARLHIATLRGRSIRGAARRLFNEQPPRSVALIELERSDEDTIDAVVQAPRETAERLTLDDLPTTLRRQGTQAAVLYSDETIDSLHNEHLVEIDEAIATMVRDGIDVGLLAAEPEHGLQALQRQCDHNPDLEILIADQEVCLQQFLERQLGSSISEHRELLSSVLGTSVTLAQELCAQLSPWSSGTALPVEIVREALGRAFVTALERTCTTPSELGTALIHLTLGPAPLSQVRSHSQRLAAAAEVSDRLLKAGFITYGPTVADIVGAGLRSTADPTLREAVAREAAQLCLDANLACDAVMSVLHSICVTSGGRAVDAAFGVLNCLEPDQRATALGPFLSATSNLDELAGAVVAVLGDRVDVWLPALQCVTDEADTFSPFHYTSLLTALEYPELSLAWAQSALVAAPPQSSTWITAAVVGCVVGMASPAASAGPLPEELIERRIADTTHQGRHVIATVRTLLDAFTAAADEAAIIALAEQVDDLRLEGWQAGLGVLVAVACLAIDQSALAERWTWLVISHHDADSVDHGCALLIKAGCDEQRGNSTSARRAADQALNTFKRNGAAAFAAIAGLATIRAGNTSVQPQEFKIPSGAHPILIALHHYLVALTTFDSVESGECPQVINVLFDVGRRLRQANIDNPVAIRWRQRLVALCHEYNEAAIAECVENDLRRDEGLWDQRNPLSAQARRGRDNGPIHPAPTAPDLSILSKSELRVVERIAAGDTNPQAADALFLSKRTVDTHLRNIYRRLGITSREELKTLAVNGVPGADTGAVSEDAAPARGSDE
ncbi:MAG: LuxR family transcriptional regulator [Propionibacteriaceae bacterium]|nr:LuxR family transcriptional regulator [Propionibacteriaceae bacterium]